LFSDLVIAVKLAVDHSMYIAVCVVERLFCFRIQINDGQTIVTKS
jgi:hypothetical protein